MPYSFSALELQPVIDLLHNRSGLDFSSSNLRQLQEALGYRIKKTRCAGISQYLQVLLSESNTIGSELHHLIEELTVGETYFYRIGAHFEVLRDFLVPQLQQQNRHINILSAACSTGEEPYTIALILKHYFPTMAFTITALDIDRNALELAKAGQYGERAVKHLPPLLRELYFDKHGAKYRLHERIKQCVMFRQGNLFESLADHGNIRYDIIFCRNVLIYFSAEKIRFLTHCLFQLGREDSYLFLGDAETLRGYNNDYQLVEKNHAFFYHKGDADIKPPPLPTSNFLAADVSPVLDMALTQSEPVNFERCVEAYLGDNMQLADRYVCRLLEVEPQHWEARLLLAMIEAGKGNYERGLQLCLEVTNLDIASHKSFFIAGLIQTATKSMAAAKRSFECALYHDRQFYPAHFKLALLHQANGEKDKARKSFANVLKTIETGQQGLRWYCGEMDNACIVKISQAGAG